MKKCLLPVLAATSLFACTPKAAPIASVAGPDCRVVRCRTDLPPLMLQVVDAAGRPVLLDRYETALAGTKTAVPMENANPLPAEGRYPVVPGTWALTHQNTRSRMVFRGYKGGRERVRETFEIGADCCSIRLVSGPEKVVVR